MFERIRKYFFRKFRFYVLKSVPETALLFEIKDRGVDLNFSSTVKSRSTFGKNVNIDTPAHISDSSVGDYSYICQNSIISRTTIGKFCSIGPNLVCGWGIHPTNGISTSPSFYSKCSKNGYSLASESKIKERKPIVIGNDVFIGSNVTILDGVTIGDGAIIGAGAVVSKDIPAYSIAVGCPICIKKNRFTEEQIAALKRIQWWNFTEDGLKDVERMFWDVDAFIEKYEKESIHHNC